MALVLLASATLAHAGSPAKQITKAIATDVISGHRPLLDFIDPARGVVGVEHGKSLHLCGEDLNGLAAMLARVSRELRTETLKCANRPSPSCTLGRDGAGYRLDFRVDETRGLVLEALVHPADAQAPSPGNCALTSPEKPTKLTMSLVRQIAWGLRPISYVIDPDRGVVRASWPNMADESAEESKPLHLCGNALDLEGFRRQLLAVVIDGELGPHFQCKNTPIRECVLSALVDEYSNRHHLVFVDDPVRGLVIESWIDLDEALTSAESKEEQRRWARKLVDNARSRPCSATP